MRGRGREPAGLSYNVLKTVISTRGFINPRRRYGAEDSDLITAIFLNVNPDLWIPYIILETLGDFAGYRIFAEASGLDAANQRNVHCPFARHSNPAIREFVRTWHADFESVASSKRVVQRLQARGARLKEILGNPVVRISRRRTRFRERRISTRQHWKRPRTCRASAEANDQTDAQCSENLFRSLGRPSRRTTAQC